MLQESKIKGYLFPIPHKFLERLFSGEKDVFVKVGHYRFLAPDHSVVFYDSDQHMTVGEAKIVRSSNGSPSAIWKEYNARIFLQEKEFKEYVARSPLGPRKQKEKIMTALVLGRLHRYSSPRKPQRRVTPAGYYITA